MVERCCCLTNTAAIFVSEFCLPFVFFLLNSNSACFLHCNMSFFPILCWILLIWYQKTPCTWLSFCSNLRSDDACGAPKPSGQRILCPATSGCTSCAGVENRISKGLVMIDEPHRCPDFGRFFMTASDVFFVKSALRTCGRNMDKWRSWEHCLKKKVKDPFV